MLTNVHHLIAIANRKKDVILILGSKFVRHVETRFLSNLKCLKGVEEKLERLYNSQFNESPFLDEQEQLIFNNIYDNRRTLRILIEILSLFEMPTITLQAAVKPTLHKVWPITLDIIKKLENMMATSSEMGKALAKSTLSALERKLKKGFITNLHKIATLLNPSTRKLNGVSAFEKLSVHREIRGLLDLPSQNRFTGELLSMEEDDEDANELKCYIDATFLQTTGETFDLLQFWQDHKTQYPQLFKIAMRVLVIPATSCSPERAFSVLKNLITDNRTSLAKDTVSAMMIGKSLNAFYD